MNIAHDFILSLLPREQIDLPAVDATRFDGQANVDWREHGLLTLHTQDARLTPLERAVLAAIGTRVRGRRIV